MAPTLPTWPHGLRPKFVPPKDEPHMMWGVAVPWFDQMLWLPEWTGLPSILVSPDAERVLVLPRFMRSGPWGIFIPTRLALLPAGSVATEPFVLHFEAWFRVPEPEPLGISVLT